MERNAPEFGRFTEPSLLILVSLSDGPKHGYAIMQDVEAGSGRPMGAGTLYAALARLEDEGFVEPLAPVDRRRPYRLTAVGATMLAEQLHGLSEFAQRGPPPARQGRAMRSSWSAAIPPAGGRATATSSWRSSKSARSARTTSRTSSSARSTRDCGRIGPPAHPKGDPMSLRIGGIAAITGALVLTVSWFGTIAGALPFDGRVLVALILVGLASLLVSLDDPERVPGPSDARTRLDGLRAFGHRRDRLHGRHARPDRRRGR